MVIVRKEIALEGIAFCRGQQNLLWTYFRTSRQISYLVERRSLILIAMSYLEKVLVPPPHLTHLGG